MDVKSAYRNVPVHPDDRWLLGMLWEGVDTALPFGLRSAPKIFTVVADAVARNEGIRFAIHYLDDFLVMGSPASEECKVALDKLLQLFGRLGIPVAANKLEGPASLLGFLGFELDTQALVVRLPREKLIDLKGLISGWVGRTSCRKSELESLAGKLAHAARVVCPGKTFMRRMFEAPRSARRGHHHIRLKPFQSDVMWLATFLESRNGVSMLQDQERAQSWTHFWTDAAGSFVCGGWYPGTGDWFQLRWPSQYDPGMVKLDIALKELLPVVLACAI